MKGGENMKKLIVGLVIGGFLLGGCSNKSEEAFQSAMTDGVEAVANEEYSKAEAFFETALKEKSDDEKAKNYLAGIEDLQTLIKYQEEGNLEEGVKLATKISDDGNTPDTIKKRATEIGDEFTAIKTNLDENTKLYTEAEQLNKEKKFSESNDKLKSIQDKQLEGPHYTELLTKTTELSKANSTELEKVATAEKAAAEQKAKEEAEQRAQAEAAQKAKEESEQKAAEEAAQNSEVTNLDSQTLEIIDFLKGAYYQAGTDTLAFEITDTYYIDYSTNQKYKISNIGVENASHTTYTIAWDIDEYEERNGEGSAGMGPQPFIYELVVGIQGNGYVLIPLGGETAYKTK